MWRIPSTLGLAIASLGACAVAVGLTGDNGAPPPGEEGGNNLSYPVIWAEGVAKDLRGTFGEVTMDGVWYYWWGTTPDGDPLACQPDPDAPPGEAYCDDGEHGTVGSPPGPADLIYIAFAQQDDFNEWQAESADASAEPLFVDWIDWGDNLEAVPWDLHSMIRTEVVLIKDLAAPCVGDTDGSGAVETRDLVTLLSSWGPCPVEGECPADLDMSGTVDTRDLVMLLVEWGDCPASEAMLEYRMRHLEGWGSTEMWGLSTMDGVPEVVTYDHVAGFPQATVYSPCPRLTIQKLLVPRDDPRLADLVWMPTEGWTEPDGYPDDLVNEPLYNMAVWESEDGPGFYNAEVNVKGKIIFGYTWNVRRMHEGASDYRITFSLDESCDDVVLNTFFGEAQIVPFEDEEEAEPVGGTAVIDVGNNLTFIDIQILENDG
jgi:hypothetical protein